MAGGTAAVVGGAADEADRRTDGERIVPDKGGVERGGRRELRVRDDDDGALMWRPRRQVGGAAVGDSVCASGLHAWTQACERGRRGAFSKHKNQTCRLG